MKAREAAALLQQRKISAVELTRGVVQRIREKDTAIGAYLTVNEEQALEQAAKVQTRLDRGENLAPLAGIPFAVKDNICTKGIRTTCASRCLEDFVPPYSATAICRLEEAGLLVLGKTNMDEFAMGSTTETSAFQVTRNPHDFSRSPGGSSGGSSAAVAAGEALIALGSDTGGSVRQPSAHCGVTGLKPTYGRVSRYGLIAYASSMDQIGVIGQDAEDCGMLFSLMAGRDPRDATSAPGRFRYEKRTARRLAGLRIAFLQDCLLDGLAPAVEDCLSQAVHRLEDLGAQVTAIPLPLPDLVLPIYYILSCAEASSNLARYDGLRYGTRGPEGGSLSDYYRNTRTGLFGREAKRRMLLGSFVLSTGHYEAYYQKALSGKKQLAQAFRALFQDFDILVGPTTAQTACRLGESLDHPLRMYASDRYTVSANLAGLPALSLPCGKDRQGLPVGLQLLGRAFDEETLLWVAQALQDEQEGGVSRGGDCL